VRGRTPTIIAADMVIGFKMFRERFTSRVVLTPPDRIDVSYAEGPFKYLQNHWIFLPYGEDSCLIDFHVDFEFRSRLLEGAISAVFGKAVQKMVGAFESRADELYG
jgi:coenzyme Q-binding protein COQ10